MSFTPDVRAYILVRDEYTCTDEECEYPPRQYHLNGTLMGLTGLMVINGGYMMQASHNQPKDYKGRDKNAYEADGYTHRGDCRCTLCHLHQEVKTTNLGNAHKLALNQTINTYDYIMTTEDKQDQDIPHGIFGRAETIDINNERRMKLRSTLLKRYGELALEVPDPMHVSMTIERAKELLGSGSKRRL